MASCSEPGVVLQAIAAAQGWRAVFRGLSGKIETAPVGGWVFVEHMDGNKHMHPMVQIGDVLDDPTSADNYLGLLSPDDDISVYAPAANV